MNISKRVCFTISFLTLLISCQEKKGKSIDELSTDSNENPSIENNPILCKINDVSWSYTKVSAIKTGDKLFVNFNNEMTNPKETVQIEYDLKQNSLIKTLIFLNREEKKGGFFNAKYFLDLKSVEQNPENQLEGKATANASIQGMAHIIIHRPYQKYAPEQLKKDGDAILTITESVSYTHLTLPTKA